MVVHIIGISARVVIGLERMKFDMTMFRFVELARWMMLLIQQAALLQQVDFRGLSQICNIPAAIRLAPCDRSTRPIAIGPKYELSTS
ncbi:hypothetical protein BRAS3843_2830004 [Bradyrhizobium sp. STM 3843]|nr:hypothetical protein BRAS3843_2830004 [Bradyrhizobium sp. STM 3843]